MTITQTVEIPADHRLTIDVPREVPEGRAILALTLTPDQKPTDRRSDDTDDDGLYPDNANEVGDECPICKAHNYTPRDELWEELLEEERAVERGEITRKVYDNLDEFWKDLLSDDEDE